SRCNPYRRRVEIARWPKMRTAAVCRPSPREEPAGAAVRLPRPVPRLPRSPLPEISLETHPPPPPDARCLHPRRFVVRCPGAAEDRDLDHAPAGHPVPAVARDGEAAADREGGREARRAEPEGHMGAAC